MEIEFTEKHYRRNTRVDNVFALASHWDSNVIKQDMKSMLVVTDFGHPMERKGRKDTHTTSWSLLVGIYFPTTTNITCEITRRMLLRTQSFVSLEIEIPESIGTTRVITV